MTEIEHKKNKIIHRETETAAAQVNGKRVAIISDTHSLLRPEIIEMVKTCDFVLHGGDISDEHTLKALQALAPVYAVRGNNDRGTWADKLPVTREITIGNLRFFMIHNKKEVPEGVNGGNTDIILFGHSHKYVCEENHGILWLNPGSCGKRRFGLAITMAVLEIKDDGRFQIQAHTLNT